MPKFYKSQNQVLAEESKNALLNLDVQKWNLNDDEIVYHKQFDKDMLPPNQRKKTFEEVVLGFHKLNAIAESMRCLHCERR